MSFAQFAGGFRTANPKAFVFISISASLLCVLYLFRLTHFHIATVASGTHHAAHVPTLIDAVFNRTLGFEKIYVISLPERSDRRDSMVLSAALSNIDIEIVDGVRGENVLDKTIPSPSGTDRFMKAEIGCWRSHINIMRDIVQRNLSSVLILEDDADWDIRLPEQLRDFALAAQALTQPLAPTPKDTLRHSVVSRDGENKYDIPFENLPITHAPKHSPYGDDWDLLWLGHCGVTVPNGKDSYAPADRVVQSMDPTVPQKKFLSNNLVADDLRAYPDHTRITHHASQGLCTLSYAISQAGAREVLMSVGVQQMTTIDFGLREWCDGTNKRNPHLCLATQPALFQPHRKAGSQTADSDIDTKAHGTGIREKAMTDVVRWSTILNWDVLLAGGNEFDDQYPDKE